VTSEPGKGSTFSVELASADGSPLTSGDGSPSEEVVPATSSTGRTILYVEDNLSNLKLMERVLSRRPGIVLLPALQGSLGVTLARDHRPDLIFLDLDLPDMRGEEVLARLHSDPMTADLPVVVISADATNGQRTRMVEAGARTFISKPFDIDRLLQVVDEFCGDSGPASTYGSAPVSTGATSVQRPAEGCS